jgi:hypothetical protein
MVASASVRGVNARLAPLIGALLVMSCTSSSPSGSDATSDSTVDDTASDTGATDSASVDGTVTEDATTTDAGGSDAASEIGALDGATDATATDTASTHPMYDAGYGCDALGAGADAGGCPAIYDRFCTDGGDAGPGYHAPCTDAALGSGSYPFYCVVTLPSSDPAIPGGPATCICQPGSPPYWACGI